MVNHHSGGAWRSLMVVQKQLSMCICRVAELGHVHVHVHTQAHAQLHLHAHKYIKDEEMHADSIFPHSIESIKRDEWP